MFEISKTLSRFEDFQFIIVSIKIISLRLLTPFIMAQEQKMTEETSKNTTIVTNNATTYITNVHYYGCSSQHDTGDYFQSGIFKDFQDVLLANWDAIGTMFPIDDRFKFFMDVVRYQIYHYLEWFQFVNVNILSLSLYLSLSGNCKLTASVPWMDSLRSKKRDYLVSLMNVNPIFNQLRSHLIWLYVVFANWFCDFWFQLTDKIWGPISPSTGAFTAAVQIVDRDRLSFASITGIIQKLQSLKPPILKESEAILQRIRAIYAENQRQKQKEITMNMKALNTPPPNTPPPDLDQYVSDCASTASPPPSVSVSGLLCFHVLLFVLSVALQSTLWLSMSIPIWLYHCKPVNRVISDWLIVISLCFCVCPYSEVPGPSNQFGSRCCWRRYGR